MDRLVFTPTGSLNVNLEFDAKLFGVSLVTGAVGLPSIGIVDTNLFDSNPPTFTVDMAPLALNLSGEMIVQGLLQVAEWLDDAINLDNVKIPLINKSVGEILASPTELKDFDFTSIVKMTAPVIEDGFKKFTTQLNLNGDSATSVGIKPGDVMKFLSTTGEQFEAIVDSVEGEIVTLIYDAERSDVPDLVSPLLSFRSGGSLSSQLKAALEDYIKPDAVIPSIGEVLNDLLEPFGMTIGGVSYNDVGKKLTFTPELTPKPYKFRSRFDFGGEVSALGFNASGDFLVDVAPTIRLPLEIDLSSGAINTLSRVAVKIDTTPEVTLAVTAQLDNPFARANLGFLSAVLAEDSGIVGNDGIEFSSTFTLNVTDPGTEVGTSGKATVQELITTGNLASSFDPDVFGSLDIEGLKIQPEIAGATIPGQIDIFTTALPNGTARGIASFDDLSELGTILTDHITFNNTIGDFESLTPEAVVAMFIQLGGSLEQIADNLDVPNGLPIVQKAVDGVVNFAQTTQDFGRQLYFNPKLIGLNDIKVTNGRLTKDATFAIRIEGGEPTFIKILASATATNNSIDDLYADINAAIAAQGLSDVLIAERQVPYGGSTVTSITDITANTIPVFVQPLQANYHRFRANFASSINLFNLGIRVGDVIEYLDASGKFRQAIVDELGLTTLSFRFDSTKQDAPVTNNLRKISLFGTENANKLAIRTKSPTSGISIEISTVQVTASDDLPTQLADDVSFGLSFNGGSPITVLVRASSTVENGTPEDMIDSLNEALDNTLFAGGKLTENVRAVLVDNRVRFVNLTGTITTLAITGATALGFGANQSQDINTSVTQLGLGPSQLVTPSFRAGTIQDLVHLLNGLIQQQFNGSPFTASLNYSDSPVRTVTFNIALGTEYEKSIDLDFSKGLDVGFTQLNISGGTEATINATAGVELTVGFDLDPIGSGVIVGPSTQLSTLDKGRGVQLKVGMNSTSTVNSSGRNNPVAPLTLNLEVRRFGNLTNNVSVTVASPNISDNVVLSDLAFDLTRELKTAIIGGTIPGLSVVNGISPIEVQATADGYLRIVSNAKSINGLTVSSGTAPFLGFTIGQVSSDADLSIKLRNGNTFNVNLDMSETLGDIKSKIEAAVGGPTILEVTFIEDRIKLQDKTTQVGNHRFKVTAVGDNNGISPVGSQLGILTEVVPVADNPATPQSELNNGDILIGTPLFRAPITDQFYVAIPNSKIFANLEVDAADIDLMTAIGIFDVGVVDGTLNFNANASLGLVDIDDPETSSVNEALDGKIRLKDFSIGGFGAVLDPELSYSGTLNLPFDGTVLSTLLPPEFLPLRLAHSDERVANVDCSETRL